MKRYITQLDMWEFRGEFKIPVMGSDVIATSLKDAQYCQKIAYHNEKLYVTGGIEIESMSESEKWKELTPEFIENNKYEVKFPN